MRSKAVFVLDCVRMPLAERGLVNNEMENV